MDGDNPRNKTAPFLGNDYHNEMNVVNDLESYVHRNKSDNFGPTEGIGNFEANKKAPTSKDEKLRVDLRKNAEDIEMNGMSSYQQLHAWYNQILVDGNVDLRESLESFVNNTNAPLEDLKRFLEQDSRKVGKTKPQIAAHEELRKCLQDMMSSNRSDASQKAFDAWAMDQQMVASPITSPRSLENNELPQIKPKRNQNIQIVPISMANQQGFQAQENPLPSHKNKASHGIFNSMFNSLYDMSMLENLENPDAAQEEAAGIFSTEDRDFVTPWYTYVIRVIMPPLGLLIFYFIFWRCYNYPNSGVWWQDACAWTFIVSEAVCYLFAMTHWVWIWNLKFRKRVTQQELNLRDQDLPTIDIMIPCYSEPTEIVEMTLKACYDMDYPDHKITCWVCDDGGKDDMKEMVLLNAARHKGKMKTRYVARIKIKGVPHHAKAGNLNNCILKEGSTGQLIIILDCDMLPEPCMARTVAPFFFKKLPMRNGKYERFGPVDEVDVVKGSLVERAEFDNETGLLQTPQAFYNLDSLDLLGQSYAYFYECQMSGWDGSGCTPCCGTGVTFNRYALEKVGGFSVGSITEDFKTSLNLCANGFKCKFFLQRMTRGVSPKELNAFMIQRQRWAVGAIQILLAGNPLFIKGLPLRARWLYFFSTVGIVYIIPVVLMGIIMYSTILAGVSISFGPTSFEQYLIIGGSANAMMMLMQYLTAWRLSCRDYLRALQDNFTVFMTLIRAIMIGFFGVEMGFAVTNKDVSFDLWLNIKHAAPHLFIYVFSGAAMVKGGMEYLAYKGLFEIPWTTEYNVSIFYYSVFWTLFIWVMISSAPRMVWYGYLRSKREAKSKVPVHNANVPAFQELPSTPMNTFPPLSPEIWKKGFKDESSAKSNFTHESNTESGTNSNVH
mmetsp:Transcript_17935/g.26566  ORF Transcript_17935/g.26566 Transcript_17935/m.26566 type:complete len:892 (-) Transcript_17935:267-2942(-)|eukprot:CAMPEP_0171461180 /NCGR_PEP_ID=MMETSP0945-20130129/5736_1 /TAXON_ID=109269 /ORGANISM="Vaucheria litorea, Strain CCMP2940" /LENGTH=891 /DNA_ID=CAMNT_0011987485 /DNA_START=51 /DNA_END=2726 /DNA_ORIENTATION=+